MCALPSLHMADDYRHLTRSKDDAHMPGCLADEYPELFEIPRLRERLEL